MEQRAKLAAGFGGAALAVMIAGGIALSAAFGGGGKTGAPAPAAAAPGTPAPSARPSVPSAPSIPVSAGLAAVKQSGPGYYSPAGAQMALVSSTTYGRPLVLPVIGSRPGWVRVLLPGRPNGSTAWLPDRAVTRRSTPYRIEINVTRKRLALYDRGRQVFSAPAGVGTSSDPTPTGRFFVQFIEPPPSPNPGYGPFILVTSAHSEKISDWEGSGDALMGIHGPLGDDRQIGTTGASVSHGCVRLHLSALARLAHIPPGTPIDITR